MSGSPLADYRDYRRQSRDGTEGDLSRSASRGSSASERRGRNYAELNKRELEKEAEENYERPLGSLVGDRAVKRKEGHDQGYLAGAPVPQDLSSTQRSPFSDFNGDIGQAYGGSDFDPEGYYGGARSASSFGEGSPAAQQEKYNAAPSSGFTSSRPAQPSQLDYNPSDRFFIHPQSSPSFGTQNFYRRCMVTGFQIGSFIGTTLGFNLIAVIAIGWFLFQKMNPFHKVPKRAKVEKEWAERITGERFSSRAAYYAEFFGYECEDLEVETEDGFVLRVHHLLSKKHKALGHPVILQHGILSNSVTFMVNEERSLAFWLLDQGYDVYLSNIRTNFKMPHRHFPRSDPRYWAWGIKEIGIYDLPAIVDFVIKRTGVKPAYIGHSQGTGTMFLALSRGMRPDLGNKLSCFIALGPSVFAGPVLRKFPFSLMRKFKSRKVWSLIFGVREFIPIISILQATLPSWLFGHVAFPIFSFLFNFHDHNWVSRQIPKFFRTIAVANSSELLYYYMSNFSYNNCILDTETREPWFPPSFPPLAIFYGTLDTLVLGKPLVERIRAHEPNVKLIKTVALEGYEHMDMIWGVNAVPECFLGVREMIEETKNGYPAVG